MAPPREDADRKQESMQVRGLLWLALLVILFALARAAFHSGVHAVFPTGWWRLW